MKFEIINDNKFIVRLNTSYKIINLDNQNEIIKNILLIIKKRYSYNIFGFYNVDIYKVSNLLSIIIFKKIEDNYCKNIDLKIINHSKKIDINIEDFDIINRVRVKNVNKKDIYKICEHYSIRIDNLHY